MRPYIKYKEIPFYLLYGLKYHKSRSVCNIVRLQKNNEYNYLGEGRRMAAFSDGTKPPAEGFVQTRPMGRPGRLYLVRSTKVSLPVDKVFFMSITRWLVLPLYWRVRSLWVA